jgi:hypothetical protein
MSEMVTVPPSIEPFRIGNVVKASVRLYRDRFTIYFGIVLRAILWLFLPIFVVIALGCVNSILSAIIGHDWATVISALLLLIFIPIFLFALIYSSAKFSLNLALISRLTFYELCALPETAEQARRETNRMLWILWLTLFLRNLIVSITISVLSSFIDKSSTKISEVILHNSFNDFVLFLLSASFSFLLPAFAYIVYFWLEARLFIPDVAVVIESNLSVFGAIERSWYLTKGQAWKIVAINLLISAMVFPLLLVAFIPLAIGIGSRAIELFDPVSSSLWWLELWPYFLASMLLLVVVIVMILPLGFVMKGVIYYGLRARKGNLLYR